MNRRQFFTMRSSGGQQIMTLSCQRLYMAYAGARNQPGTLATDQSSNDGDWWSGEPPLEVAALPVKQLFGDLEKETARADVLVLTGREWMQEDDFSCFVAMLLEKFRIQGGEIRYSTCEQNEKPAINQ